MNHVDSRYREVAQAPHWCLSKYVDVIAVLTLAAETGDVEWRARAVDELIRVPSPHRRQLLANAAHRWRAS